MSRIKTVRCRTVCIPLRPEFRMVSALGKHEQSHFVLVEVESDRGTVGVGEATITVRWSGETPAGTVAVINDVLTPAIEGVDVDDIETINSRMDSVSANNWFAKSAIEMACWDVVGKETEKPVFELLGGACRDLTITARFSMGAYEPERAEKRATELVEMGFQTIKVKVGGIPEKDVERVRIVRSVIGDERKLVIDANAGWSVEDALKAMHAMEPYRVALAEQPTPVGDYAGMARVRKETGVPTMADDTCFDLCQAVELIRNESCDVISVYPGKNGGISKSKAIADYAEQHGVACSIGSNLEWDVATAAMGHLIVATPNLKIEEYPGDILGPIYHTHRIAKVPLDIQCPTTTISDRPGLGIELDENVVKQFETNG